MFKESWAAGRVRRGRRLVAGVGVAAFAAASLLVGGAATAWADTDDPGLPPDVPAYCVTHPPFALQSEVNGWTVSFDHVEGSPGANNTACDYAFIAKVPAGQNQFTIPYVFHQTISVDFRDLCNWMYPGATTEWSTARRGWTCIGKPGRQYGAQGFDGVVQFTDS